MTLNYTKHLFTVVNFIIVAGLLSHCVHFTHIADNIDKKLSSYLRLSDIDEIAARGRHTHSESGSVSAFGDDLIAQFSVGSNV